MKKLLFLVFIIAGLQGCKKDKDEPAPELSARAAGTYKASKLTYGGVDLPITTAGSELLIVLEKAGSETVTGKMKLKIDGESEPDESLGTLILKDAGDSGIDLYESSVRVGNISKSNQLTISAADEGIAIEVVAQRQ